MNFISRYFENRKAKKIFKEKEEAKKMLALYRLVNGKLYGKIVQYMEKCYTEKEQIIKKMNEKHCPFSEISCNNCIHFFEGKVKECKSNHYIDLYYITKEYEKTNNVSFNPLAYVTFDPPRCKLWKED
jgi:hypothetical protein